MNKRYIKYAFILSVITVIYNVIEGSISVYYGLEDEALSLLGFGVDSFVEVISGLGILHMTIRMKMNPVKERDEFEKQALRITGFTFYLLTAGLIIGSVINIISESKPETTMVGIIISVISLLTMYNLYYYKVKVGKELKSDAILADANCTKACFHLSFVLLSASLLYEVFAVSYFDILGSLGIAYLAFKEGKESFDKVKSGNLSCSCSSNCEEDKVVA